MWTEKYTGLPYVEGGRGPHDFDCVGLFLFVIADRKGVVVRDPINSLDDHSAALDLYSSQWKQVKLEEIDEADALVFHGREGGCLHIGYALNSLDMLHAEPSRGSLVERWSRRYWRSRLIGAYRHRYLC